MIYANYTQWASYYVEAKTKEEAQEKFSKYHDYKVSLRNVHEIKEEVMVIEHENYEG